MNTSYSERWRRRPRIGAKGSIALHFFVLALCVVAIRGGVMTLFAWILFAANALAAASIAVNLRNE